MIKAVDLFCGAGGLTHGLGMAGINVEAGYDIEPSCKFAYEKNNEAIFFEKDVAELTGKDIKKHFKNAKVTLLAGCAPCQPFSRYSGGRDTTKDNKWPLLYEFSRLIKEANPEVVTMENVPDVTKHSVYHDFVKDLEQQGYIVWASRIFCPDYGLPQMRKRHVLIASRSGSISLMEPTHTKDSFVTVRDVISHLPSIKAGEKCETDSLHRAPRLSPINLKRIQFSKEGGTWKDWPESLRAACHQKESGRNYTGVYARMKWDEPSPTMTTQCFGFGNGRFGHPEQDRAISLREAAIFQTFPQDYKFLEDNKQLKFTELGKMIGNAVPVKLGEVIGWSILRHYESLGYDL